jgi:hypothetical protein
VFDVPAKDLDVFLNSKILLDCWLELSLKKLFQLLEYGFIQHIALILVM